MRVVLARKVTAHPPSPARALQTKLGAYDNLHLKIVGDKIVPTVEPIIHRGEF